MWTGLYNHIKSTEKIIVNTGKESIVVIRNLQTVMGHANEGPGVPLSLGSEMLKKTRGALRNGMAILLYYLTPYFAM
jgi:hypothetical protein